MYLPIQHWAGPGMPIPSLLHFLLSPIFLSLPSTTSLFSATFHPQRAETLSAEGRKRLERANCSRLGQLGDPWLFLEAQEDEMRYSLSMLPRASPLSV